MREQPTIPIGPRWLAEPELLWIPVEKIESGVFSDERKVTIRVNGDMLEAIVLAEDLSEDGSKMKGLAVGRFEDHVIVILRPASMGRSVLRLTEQVYEELSAHT